MINAVDIKSKSNFKRGKTTYKDLTNKHQINDSRDHRSEKIKLNENEEHIKHSEKRANCVSFADRKKYEENDDKNNFSRKVEINESLKNNEFYDNFHKMLKDENSKSMRIKKKTKQSNKSQHIELEGVQRVLTYGNNQEKVLIEKNEHNEKLKKIKTLVSNENDISRIKHNMVSEKKVPTLTNVIPQKEKKKSCCFPFFFN